MIYINRLWRRKHILHIMILSCFLMNANAATAQAYHYKSNRLLSFSEGQRDWFYTGSFMSIGHVVSMSNKAQGTCVWDWYFKNPKEKIPVVEEALKAFPDHSPTAIFIGLLEKDCGKF